MGEKKKKIYEIKVVGQDVKIPLTKVPREIVKMRAMWNISEHFGPNYSVE